MILVFSDNCRAFVAGQYDKPKKCGYNPYTAEWDNA